MSVRSTTMTNLNKRSRSSSFTSDCDHWRCCSTSCNVGGSTKNGLTSIYSGIIKPILTQWGTTTSIN